MAHAYLQIMHKGMPLPGSSREPGWLNWIELSQVIQRSGSVAAVQQGRGQERLVEVVKEFDASSPALAQGLAQKMTFDSMTIDLVTVRDRKPERYARLEFSTVTIVSRSLLRNNESSLSPRSASSQERDAERVAFHYAAMKSAPLVDAPPSRDEWK